MASISTPGAQTVRTNVHVIPSANVPTGNVQTGNVQASNRTMVPGAKATPVATAAPAAMPNTGIQGVRVRLATAVLSTIDYAPVVRVVPAANGEAGLDSLPNGEFGASGDTALDRTLRAQISATTGLTLGYLNQLATFADRPDSQAAAAQMGAAQMGAAQMADGQLADGPVPSLTVGYLALLYTAAAPRPAAHPLPGRPAWVSCYTYLPWEDWRNGRPSVIATEILPRLNAWAANGIIGGASGATAAPATLADDRHRQIQICFDSAHAWDDERVLERYELMQAAGLFAAGSDPGNALGRPMAGGYRRILAAALGRLRSKLRYRPVVFELMAQDFTLFELQRTVEGIIGPHLHKQNFRRLVESMGLVEATGAIKTHTGGRPAKLFRFRPGVVLEQASPGMRVRPGHA